MARAPSEGLKRIFLRAINRNQQLILSQVGENKGRITPALQQISGKHGVPLSTLKLNAKIMRDLGLIRYGTVSTRSSVELTDLGRFVLGVIEGVSVPEEYPLTMNSRLGLAFKERHGEAMNGPEGRGFTYIGEGGD